MRHYFLIRQYDAINNVMIQRLFAPSDSEYSPVLEQMKVFVKRGTMDAVEYCNTSDMVFKHLADTGL